MENDPPYAGDDARSSKRGRLMGKLFGAKAQKPVASDPGGLDAFLHNSADSLQVSHPPPPPPPASMPKLAKLDTTISRYPQALAVNQKAQLNRPAAPGVAEPLRSPRPSPRPNKKGLMVRFADTYPEIIGEGGDETETPVIEIGKRKAARSSPVPPPHRRQMPSAGGPPPSAKDPRFATEEDDFVPKPLSRTQTGFSSIYGSESEPEAEPPRGPSPPRPTQTSPQKGTLVPGRNSSARFLETTGRHDENRRSFIEIHQAQMRDAEAQAFAMAARTASAASQHDWEEGEGPPSDPFVDSPESSRAQPVSPEAQVNQPVPLDYSPAGSIVSLASSNYQQSDHSQSNAALSRQASIASQMEPQQYRQNHPYTPSATATSATSTASHRLHDVVTAAGDDALATFVARTKHLFELFRLHAEAVKPLSRCSLQDSGRGALWWFLKGRTGLELAVRERPNSPQAQMQNELDRQQAYTNLAKGYWLSEEIIPEIAGSLGLPPDPELVEVTQGLVSALRKLAMSMKRNGFMPPEEAFLPQTIDKAIWIEYPPVSQDMLALLSGNWASGMTAMQQPMSTLRLLDAFPVADSPANFSYGRITADVFLMEQGREAQRFYFPCFLSMVRPQNKTSLIFVIASQNGSIQLVIQENNNSGPVWDDVRWRNDTCTLDVRLPRGFMLAVQLTQQDYRMLWSMYDFGSKLRSTLRPRSDEKVVFQNTLKSFQYMDADPQSRAFPKEPVSQCDVALMEKVYKQNGPNGPRNLHRGFRIAVVTGPRTRTLSGVHHAYPPAFPVQFGFFRADGEAPALSLKFENGRQRGRMVLIFSDEKERLHFHSLLTGTAIDHGEKIVADLPLKSLVVSQSLREPTGMAPFNRMPWKAARVVNEEYDASGDDPPTILADKLRVVLEYQNGTMTDRVNVEPGELRVRLEVSNAKVLRLLRQPQQDVTISVSEAQVPKELPRNMSDALQLLKNNQTIRTLEFGNLKDLHDFQLALTGFEVVFDALAATFAIARRRMVVPIHKKWEAGYTRIQVVRQEDKQLQLLAFFEDFHHGHCMNFVLKGTDVYESMQRSGKAGVRFVDAKFPLPRLPADKDGDYDDMAFVCLDLPDLPGEHDDISIMFEKESDRDLLCQVLPAPVKGSMKLVSRLK